MCCSFLTWLHVHRGDEQRGRLRAAQSLAMCETLNDPGTWGFVEAVLATFCCLIGDYGQGEVHARRVTELGEAQEMAHWAAQGHFDLGWALQGQGATDAGVEHLHQGIAGFALTGTRAALSYVKGALVEAELKRGNLDEAEKVLDELFSFIEESDERFYEPELWRLQAELALVRAGPGAATRAATSLRRAADIAREQGAHGFARRAAEKLAAVPPSA
jgi:tetratricopeptide (TPR) repeat protein